MRVVGWSIAAMTEEDLEAGGKLWRELAKKRAHLSAECTADKVGHEGAWCQEAMSSVLNAAAKKIRKCTRSQRWWNAHIKEKRKEVGREKRRRSLGEPARAKEHLQKSIP